MHNESTILNDGQIQTVATYYVPQVVNPSNKVIVFVGQWYEVSGEFIAVGGEKYLTIGNFNSFNSPPWCLLLHRRCVRCLS